MTSQPPRMSAAHSTRKPRRITRGVVLDVATRVVLLITLVAAGYFGVRQYNLASCLAEYQDASVKSSRARAAAADRDRAAEDAMWQAFADASDPAKVPPQQAKAYAAAAFAQFLAQRTEAGRQRAANPLPPGPSKVCR